LCCVIYELLAGRHPYDKNSALVVRAQKLRPDRINGLTDTQWDTLATGLSTSQEGRTTEVRDLLAAFSRQAPLLTASPPARNLPVRKKRHFGRSTALAIAGFLFGAGIVSGMVIFDIGSIPSQYIDRARESALAQQLQAVLANRSGESITPGQAHAPASQPEALGNAHTANSPPVSPLPADATEDTAAGADDFAVITVPVADSSGQGTDEVQKPQAESKATDEGDSAMSVSTGIDENIAPVYGTPGFELSSANYVIRENGTVLAVQIVRKGDLSTFASVEWSTYAGSARPQLDYAETDRRLEQFAAGESSKTILVPIVSDNIVESDEDFRISLGRPSGDMDLLEPFTASVTIIDDDG